MSSSTDRIERQILLKAPRSRVWRALTNAEEFGNWFGAKLQGKTFAVGQRVEGQITIPGYEHIVFAAVVERMEPERLFSFRWPHTEQPPADLTKEPTTLVEFTLQEVEGGTLLTLVESGFDGLPPGLREKAFRDNSGGWDFQMQNIAKHVSTP
jgi:uncharacterized protein YndB with AHSA1/START domain